MNPPSLRRKRTRSKLLGAPWVLPEALPRRDLSLRPAQIVLELRVAGKNYRKATHPANVCWTVVVAEALYLYVTAEAATHHDCHPIAP